MVRVVALAIALIAILMAIPATATAQGSGSIVRFGSDVAVGEDERVNGSVVLFGADAEIEGEVTDDVVVFGGALRLDGRVRGDVVTFGTDTALGERARLGGDFAHFGGALSRSPQAQIAGDEITGIGFGVFDNTFFFLLASLVSLLFTLAIAVAVAAILPEQTRVLADTIEQQPWPSFGAGLLATLLIPFVFAVLGILIIVGWLIIPLFALALPIVYFYGYVGVSRWLGRRVMQAAGNMSASAIAQVAVGVLILGVISLIPIAGWLVVIIAALIGLGAVLLSKFGTGRPWRRGTAPPQPTGEPGDEMRKAG